ncbi:hypothetical protein K7X08_010436 [Anisodus acutangulus]|uniref:Uncharacterized protein n=1 Tax=Anisodus acutangulus TaxID=402998 RepID=A0A9Q1N564_9SOLA|nr:hypothetical protein K7X08_010436 [Anisodus acutangulus]
MGTADGVFHDFDSMRLRDFSVKIGICTSFRAELHEFSLAFRKSGIGGGVVLPCKLIMLVQLMSCELEELCLIEIVLLSMAFVNSCYELELAHKIHCFLVLEKGCRLLE